MENRPRERPSQAENSRQSSRWVALPATAGRARTNAVLRLPRQRRGVARDQLDKVGLAAGAGLFEQAAQVRLDRGLGDAETLGHFAHTALFHHRQQHAQFGGRQAIGSRDDLRPQRAFERGFAHEQRGSRGPRTATEAAVLGRKWQDVADVASTLAIAQGERDVRARVVC